MLWIKLPVERCAQESDMIMIDKTKITKEILEKAAQCIHRHAERKTSYRRVFHGICKKIEHYLF